MIQMYRPYHVNCVCYFFYKVTLFTTFDVRLIHGLASKFYGKFTSRNQCNNSTKDWMPKSKPVQRFDN